ncbi:hypothetical protein CEP53_007620 [Fusarium sp. AF-6]|nr:hypothetical protein CEP53_007620 [Fusarium sp. AF-6]
MDVDGKSLQRQPGLRSECVGIDWIHYCCLGHQLHQGVLETRLINYMGKISFSPYLVHGLGNQFIGKPLIHFMWNNFTGREPGFWKECSWLFAIALYIPILIWLADIFWRLVDAPSVTFAKMVEGKCFG